MDDSWLNILVPLAFLIVFPLFWSAIVIFISVIAGWGTLATAYPFTAVWDEPLGKWGWQTLSMRWANYSAVVQLAAYQEGLLFDVYWMFRPGHRPFLVPWEELSVTNKQVLWQKIVRIRCERAPHIWVDMPERTAAKIAEVVGKRWPTEAKDTSGYSDGDRG